MYKVLHVGITAPTYSSEAITASLKDVFGDVVYFDWQFYRFNLGTVGMQEKLLQIATELSPDIIFLHFNHNLDVLSYENYAKLSEISKLITYTEDVRDDISKFKEVMPFVEKMIFTNYEDVEELNAMAPDIAEYLPVSYNHIWYKPQPLTKKYYGDIVFLGNNYINTNLNFPNAAERQQVVDALKKEFGSKFQAYGNGQENRMLNPQEAVECYNNAKLSITHNNFSRRGYQSDRGLNSMGCGCPTIIHYYDGCSNDFPLISCKWRSIDSLVDMCRSYLFFVDEADNMGFYQHNEVRNKHTWVNRASAIKKMIYG